MTEQSDISHSNEDDISLKDLILKLKEFYTEIISHWRLIAIITLPIVLYMMYGAIKSKPKYPAVLTFTVNEDDGTSLGGMSGLLGQFGIGTVNSEYNLDKMLVLLKSRHITEKVLYYQDTLNGVNDFMGNHLITHLDSLGEWGKIKWYKRLFLPPSELIGYRFFQDSIQEFSLLDNMALKVLHKMLIGDPQFGGGLLNAYYSETSGILSISLAMKDEKIAISLINKYFEELSKYYIDNAIEKQKVTYDLVKLKHDSIYAELRTAEYQLADFKDRNLGIFTRKSELEEIRLENKIRILAAGLAKAVENLEVADFTLKNKTPFISVVDRPLSPIKYVRTSKFKTLIVSGFIGVLIGIVFVIIRKVFRDALRE